MPQLTASVSADEYTRLYAEFCKFSERLNAVRGRLFLADGTSPADEQALRRFTTLSTFIRLSVLHGISTINNLSAEELSALGGARVQGTKESLGLSPQLTELIDKGPPDKKAKGRVTRR